MSYEDDIKIDPENLDIEWLNQPNLVFKYSKELAEATKERDQAKGELELVQADLDNHARTDPTVADMIGKITEKSVSSWVIQHHKYQEALEKFNDLKYEVMILTAVMNSLEHKKKALEHLVQLLIAQYFSGPKEPRNLARGEMQAKVRDERTTKQRKKLNKGKKGN